MNAETELWVFAVSVGASALGGMLGMASGIFIVPILTLFGHVDLRSAISNDRIRILFVAVLGALAVQMFLAAFGIGLYRRAA
jgi:uncharacterized protein